MACERLNDEELNETIRRTEAEIRDLEQLVAQKNKLVKECKSELSVRQSVAVIELYLNKQGHIKTIRVSGYPELTMILSSMQTIWPESTARENFGYFLDKIARVTGYPRFVVNVYGTGNILIRENIHVMRERLTDIFYESEYVDRNRRSNIIDMLG
jgi:hypothetical protein